MNEKFVLHSFCSWMLNDISVTCVSSHHEDLQWRSQHSDNAKSMFSFFLSALFVQLLLLLRRRRLLSKRQFFDTDWYVDSKMLKSPLWPHKMVCYSVGVENISNSNRIEISDLMYVSTDEHSHLHASDTIYNLFVMWWCNYMNQAGWRKTKLAIHFSFHFHADLPLVTHTICEHHRNENIN